MQISEKQNILTRTWVVAALACVCCILWGSAIPVIKTGYRILTVDSADTASQTVRIHPGKKSCPSGRKDIQVCYPGLLCSDLRPVLFLLHRSGTYIRCKRRDHHRPRQFYCNFNGMSVSKK